MPTNNVVPIDAEVARAIARRAIKFRWFVAALTAVWLGTLIPVLLFTPLPPLVPFLVLGGLLVLAEHRFVLFGDETSMSGSIIVAVASIFVFADTAPLAGPMLVASLGGLYLPHLRRREPAKVLTNASAIALAELGAAITTYAIASSSGDNARSIAARIVISTLTYWVVNNAIVAGYVAVREGCDVRPVLATLTVSDTSVLVWCGLAGAGIALTGRPAIDILSVTMCLAANAIVSSRRLSVAQRAADLRKRNTLIRDATCWSVAVASLAATGASPVQLAVLTGSGIGYTVWSRSQTSAFVSSATAALTALAVSWLDPLTGLAVAALGVVLLCVVSFTRSGLRMTCVLTTASAISVLIGDRSLGGLAHAVIPFICLIVAAAAPQLLAAVLQSVRARSMSFTTVAGISVPSRWDLLLAVVSYLVLVALANDPLAGVLALTCGLMPVVWLYGRSNLNYRRSAAGGTSRASGALDDL